MVVTILLIAVTIAVSLSAWQQPQLMDRFIYWPPAVRRGEWWRLLTHGFVHADGAHLAVNMIVLFFFGRAMEPLLAGRIGELGFLGFYLGGIVLAMLPTHVRRYRDNNFRSLGASGAVAALLFAYILVEPWSMLLVLVIPMPAIVFAALYVGYSIWAERYARDNVNHGAHIAGAVWGVVFMLALEPRLLALFFERLSAPPGF
jgi:membrane associated rhomboid family serine protease